MNFLNRLGNLKKDLKSTDSNDKGDDDEEDDDDNDNNGIKRTKNNFGQNDLDEDLLENGGTNLYEDDNDDVDQAMNSN